MTENDLNARLARMETSLRHIEQDVQDAKQERADAARQTQDFVARLAHLEAGGKALSGLPARVAHTESVNDVQEAVKAERAHMSREIRAFVLGGFTIAGVVFAIASYILGNGP